MVEKEEDKGNMKTNDFIINGPLALILSLMIFIICGSIVIFIMRSGGESLLVLVLTIWGILIGVSMLRNIFFNKKQKKKTV